MTPRVAVVASNDPLCGIASYAAALAGALRVRADVEIMGISPAVMRAASAAPGDALIRAHASRLGDFDAVNVQVEWGTFGRGGRRIRQRLESLLNAAPKAAVTLHTVPRPAPPDWEAAWRRLRAGRAAAAAALPLLQLYDRMLAGPAYYRLLRRIQKIKPLSVIVHRPSDARLLRERFGLGQVFDHPLAYLSQVRIAGLRARPVHPLRAALPADSILAGVFGFIGDYKGVDIAIEALRLLPPNHHLAVFGDVHPNSVSDRPDPVLANLTTLAREPELSGRVHFMGACDEPEFLSAMLACDAVLLPYRETGNSASGPASLAIELGCRVIASRTAAFTELAEYFAGRLELFDIGDFRQLARLLTAPPVRPPTTDRSAYSLETNRTLYLRALELPVAP